MAVVYQTQNEQIDPLDYAYYQAEVSVLELARLISTQPLTPDALTLAKRLRPIVEALDLAERLADGRVESYYDLQDHARALRELR